MLAFAQKLHPKSQKSHSLESEDRDQGQSQEKNIDCSTICGLNILSCLLQAFLGLTSPTLAALTWEKHEMYYMSQASLDS